MNDSAIATVPTPQPPVAPIPRQPPRPPSAPAIPPRSTATATTAKVTFGPIGKRGGIRVGFYGTGGIGKTTMAAMAPGPIGYIDLDGSLPLLEETFSEMRAEGINPDIRVASGITDLKRAREALDPANLGGIKTVVIDTATKLEEMIVEHVLKTIKVGNSAADSLEDYGYGKGYQHVYEAFLKVLADLDKLVAAGINVILICHECTATVPNPAGEDYIRFEPRLQTGAKASIRARLKEWADHLLFYSYDINVAKKKSKGSGTRSIYPVEMAHCMAKSRTLADSIEVKGKFDPTIWKLIFGE